jgi:hypothetical protein
MPHFNKNKDAILNQEQTLVEPQDKCAQHEEMMSNTHGNGMASFFYPKTNS